MNSVSNPPSPGLWRRLRQRRAIQRIVEDIGRNLLAGYGARLIAPARMLAGLAGARRLHLKLLMLEHRLCGSARLTARVRPRLPQIIANLPVLMGPSDIPEIPPDDDFRAIVLSLPEIQDGRVARGVLLIKFTETFRYFYHYIDVERLMRFFRVVLEPSWSGYCLPEILFWTRYRDPVIVQASEPLDRQFLSQIGTNLVPVPFGASDWVDHRVFRPLGLEKTHDAIYVANLTPIKRVHVFLRAVREMARKRGRVRAVVALSSWGGNQRAFEELVEFYGVGGELTVLMNQTQQQLNEWLNRCRVSVLLSRKEGSNKTLFESMFAGTPVLLLRNNVGVNKDYINEHTGRLVTDDGLADAMLDFVEGRARAAPRQWAMQHLAPEVTTRKLEAIIQDSAGGSGISHVPLFVKVNSPEATYMHAEDAGKVPPIGLVLKQFRYRRSDADTVKPDDALVRELRGAAREAAA